MTEISTISQKKMNDVPPKDTPEEDSRIRLRNNLPQPEALQLIPESVARKHNVIPLMITDHTLWVAMANPSDIIAIEALAAKSQMRIEIQSASADEIQEAIDFNYKAYDEIEKKVSSIPQQVQTVSDKIKLDNLTDTPIAQALTMIIDEAVKARASDIHLQPQEDRLRVRYRIDGTLHDTVALPVSTTTPLISRIKVLSNMNIAEHNRPQDGHFSVKTMGRVMDIRVGTTATIHGEMATLRLLDKSRATLALADLGFFPESLTRYENMLRAPYGMILSCGPTGAGKTTTLYASINRLDCIGQNIITIEDPVEYRFKNINQIQINSKAGLTFAAGLRSILRLDPNVILVGEIRDSETANIAVQSALTGHLVLSTIHANDAAGAILRLIDLKVEPFLAATAVVGVVAQRMVRHVCPDCARPIIRSPLERMHFKRETGEERDTFLYGSGCNSCVETGYRGRTGLFEILYMTEKLRKMVLDGTTAAELRSQAMEDGMVSLMRDGMLKVKAGITTPAEVLRSAYSVEDGE